MPIGKARGSKQTGLGKRNSRATTKSGTRAGKKPSATGRANALTRSGGKRNSRATSALTKTR